MAGTLTVDTIQSDSSYASTLNVASKMNFAAGMQIGGQDTTFGGMRNRIINGDMRIDQRNAGASVTPASSVYTLDRWLANLTAASKFSVAQSTVAPAGFTNSVLLTSTSAYSIVSGDYNAFQHRIEANNMMDAGWGTSDAKTFTLSFWVRSSLTGTFGGSLYFPATTVRTFPFSYVINSANTWEYKTVTITGDITTNTAPTGNNLYVILQWALGAGSTYTTATTGWQNGNFACPTGSTNLIATNGATLYITGVQLEKGSAATAFEYRQFGTELALCQRYYEKSFDIGTAVAQNSGTFNGTSVAPSPGTLSGMSFGETRYKVNKRNAATVTFYNPAAANAFARDQNANVNCTATSAWMAGESSFGITASTGSGSGVTNRVAVHWSADSEL